MRNSWLSLLMLGLLGAELRAQQPAPRGPDPNQQLDQLLQHWEQAMGSVQTIAAQCTRTSVDKVFQQNEVYEGTARYMKPNLAMLDLRQKDNPQVFEKFICTGTYLYEFSPQRKELRIHELPPPKSGQVADDNFLSFLFGMKAEEAHRRYDLRLVQVDQWYVYIEIYPRFPADKADFTRARLVLNKQSFLPRQLWFEQPNKNEVRWDIPKIDSGVALNRNDFTSPQVPAGWTTTRVPRTDLSPRNAGPPRVVRPNQ